MGLEQLVHSDAAVAEFFPVGQVRQLIAHFEQSFVP
jgi:hypothetical protein